ncbi:LysR family transcriptional regulator [Actinoplanes subtropicus]|uniref:LysR family transcriptional regulator n=1 Tax=Actinoplanes subtropicus TaxID=543632 RepID=UPI0004C3E7BE
MELRDIEIFLTLAEELHFGRTAERLRVSSARVSQSIKQQERRIGGALFERTSRSVRLTPLGRRFRDRLDAGYREIAAGLDEAATIARDSAGSRLPPSRGRRTERHLGVGWPGHHPPWHGRKFFSNLIPCRTKQPERQSAQVD